MTNEELVDKVDELEMINKRLVEELMWSINAYLDILILYLTIMYIECKRSGRC